MPTHAILNSYTLSELKKEISQHNIKGYSKMKKAEVIKLMLHKDHRHRFAHKKKKVRSAIVKRQPPKQTPKQTSKPAQPPVKIKRKPKITVNELSEGREELFVEKGFRRTESMPHEHKSHRQRQNELHGPYDRSQKFSTQEISRNTGQNVCDVMLEVSKLIRQNHKKDWKPRDLQKYFKEHVGLKGSLGASGIIYHGMVWNGSNHKEYLLPPLEVLVNTTNSLINLGALGRMVYRVCGPRDVQAFKGALSTLSKNKTKILAQIKKSRHKKLADKPLPSFKRIDEKA